MSRVRRIIVAALLSGSLLAAIAGGVVTHAFAADPNASCAGQYASIGESISSDVHSGEPGPGNSWLAQYEHSACP